MVTGDEEKELNLVHNETNLEWQFWHGEDRCSKPAAGWDTVSSKGDVLLRSGQ